MTTHKTYDVFKNIENGKEGENSTYIQWNWRIDYDQIEQIEANLTVSVPLFFFSFPFRVSSSRTRKR